MTIQQAIEMTDAQKPNGYSDKDKIHWLDKLDRVIWETVIITHEDAPEEAFEGYTEETDLDTELLADEAYSDLYIKWLGAQIDYANQEIQRYNNSATMFGSMMNEYRKDYNRKHRPVRNPYIKGVRA